MTYQPQDECGGGRCPSFRTDILTRSTVAFNLITYPVVDGNQVDERIGLLTTNEIAADNQTLGKTHHHFNLGQDVRGVECLDADRRDAGDIA